MEHFAEILKIFLEKYFIPTVMAILVAIVVMLYLPGDYWMIEKIGRFLFFILVVGLAFLAIIFIIFCYQKICAKSDDNEARKYRNKVNDAEEKKAMDVLWSAVDRFSPDDRKLIKEFLVSGNKAIERSSGTRYFGNSLLNSDWVVHTEEYGEEEKYEVILSDKLKGKAIPVNPGFFENARPIIVKYKLCDDIYASLKYSMDNYGKISHFD